MTGFVAWTAREACKLHGQEQAGKQEINGSDLEQKVSLRFLSEDGREGAVEEQEEEGRRGGRREHPSPFL